MERTILSLILDYCRIVIFLWLLDSKRNAYVDAPYLSVLIEHVVGQFEFLEADGLFAELFSGEGRVGVHIEPGGKGWVSLPCY